LSVPVANNAADARRQINKENMAELLLIDFGAVVLRRRR